MEVIIYIAIVAVILFLLLKRQSIVNHENIRNESSKKIAQEEAEKARLYEERKNQEGADITIVTTMQTSRKFVDVEERPRKTPEDILKELLSDDTWKMIPVDAELVFKNANRKNEYYLHATHYFPEKEEVFGTNANGKIVWVDLYNQKEATNPTTGERIPGIRRYLRQNSI